jgi:hypothetical protein
LNAVAVQIEAQKNETPVTARHPGRKWLETRADAGFALFERRQGAEHCTQLAGLSVVGVLGVLGATHAMRPDCATGKFAAHHVGVRHAGRALAVRHTRRIAAAMISE